MAESSSPNEDSKSSSDETDRSDQNYEYLGSGRSYECVFCKRGFTTAQALGGHMNIHRKHRAPKTSPSNINYSTDNHHHHHQEPLVSSNLAAEDHHHHKGYSSFRPFFAIETYPQVHFGHHGHHQVHVNYHQTYNSSSTTRPSQDFNCNSRYDIVPNDLLGENWRGTALSLAIGTPRRHEDDDEDDDEDDAEDHINHNSRKISGDFGEDHVEVDLELRLGYDP